MTYSLSRVLCLVYFFYIQSGNMAREGLRTLVVSKKVLSEEQYQDFEVIKLNYTGKKCEFHTMKFAIPPLNP